MVFLIEQVARERYCELPHLEELRNLSLQIYQEDNFTADQPEHAPQPSTLHTQYLVATHPSLRDKFRPKDLSKFPQYDKLASINAAGFIRVDSGNIQESELGELVTWKDWPNEPGIYLGAFTAHPLLRRVDKLQVLGDLGKDLFRNIGQLGISPKVWLLTIHEIALFVEEAGLNLTPNPQVRIDQASPLVSWLSNTYPGYWKDHEQVLYEVTPKS